MSFRNFESETNLWTGNIPADGTEVGKTPDQTLEQKGTDQKEAQKFDPKEYETQKVEANKRLTDLAKRDPESLPARLDQSRSENLDKTLSESLAATA